MTEYRYLFGPVPSRRLGLSLGIDLVPFKTCSYDCIYCQLGRTTCLTAVRKEYVPLDAVLREVEKKLAEPGKIDYLTLSGSGEPTLYAPLGELLNGLKRLSEIPVAVLTNGSLLWDPEVASACRLADVVVPSLDAGTEELYRYVNRPCPTLSFDTVMRGLIDFSARRANALWLEVLLLDGVTAIEAEVKKLNNFIREIRPDKIQLNTVVRPSAEEYAFTVPAKRLGALADLFDGKVEVIADRTRPEEAGRSTSAEREIISLLARRPCSVDDIAEWANLHHNEVIKYLEKLVERHILITERTARGVYYALKR